MELHKVEQVGAEYKFTYKQPVLDINGNTVEIPRYDIKSEESLTLELGHWQNRKADCEANITRLQNELTELQKIKTL